MKFHVIVLAFVSTVAAVSFGPNQCVDLSKSAEGSCVIRTNCAGVDTSKFEFAFDCQTATGLVQRHSFGFGGFDANEEFDTAVKCKECAAPEQEIKTSAAKQEVMAVGVQSSAAQQRDDKDKKDEKKKEEKKEEKEEKKEEVKLTPADGAKIAKAGPDNCVSIWRDEKTAHCVVKTECQDKDTTDYMFGLICDGTTGPVRHLFGKDSFEAVETFDTLIPCTECLALSAIPEDVQLAQEISDLGDSIKGMAAGMKALSANVTKLNEKVFDEEKKDEEKKDEEKKEAAAAKATKEEVASAEKKEDDSSGAPAAVNFMRERNSEADDDSDDADASSDDASLSDSDIDESVSSHKESKLRGHAAHKRNHKVHHARKHRHHAQDDDEDTESDNDEDADSDASHKGEKKNKVAEKEDAKSDADSSDDASSSKDDDASDTKDSKSDADTDDDASDKKDDSSSDKKVDDSSSDKKVDKASDKTDDAPDDDDESMDLDSF